MHDTEAMTITSLLPVSKDEVALSSLPLAFQNGYIGLVIGAQHFTKRLPKAKLFELLQGLTQPVIILGGPTDAELAEEFKNLKLK